MALIDTYLGGEQEYPCYPSTKARAIMLRPQEREPELPLPLFGARHEKMRLWYSHSYMHNNIISSTTTTPIPRMRSIAVRRPLSRGGTRQKACYSKCSCFFFKKPRVDDDDDLRTNGDKPKERTPFHHYASLNRLTRYLKMRILHHLEHSRNCLTQAFHCLSCQSNHNNYQPAGNQ